MARRKRGITVRQIAREAGQKVDLVRSILKEVPHLRVSRDVRDAVFKTARRLGYDFLKLKIGKRMQYRKEVFVELVDKIRDHPDWGRAEILRHLEESLGFVERVHRRVFREEYGDGDA